MTKTQPVEVTAQEFLGRVNAAREQSDGSSVFISNYRIIPDTNGEKILSTTENPADLTHCTFTGIDFNAVCMEGALLSDSTIEKCNLRGTNFNNANGKFNIVNSDVTDTIFCLGRYFRLKRSYYFIGHKPRHLNHSNNVDLVCLSAIAYNLIKDIQDPNQFLSVLQLALADPEKSPGELIWALCNINHSNPRLGGALARIAAGQLTNAR
jgi:uncharacterized protein YjbI with pentapeptide repeats